MARTKQEDNNKKLLKELNIEKEDLIEEIKKNIQEELYDEITSKVDYESKKTLEKMEKRIYKYKNKSILKRNILILIFLVIIIYETKMLYDNNLLFELNKEELVEIKEDINNNEETKQEEVEEEKDLNWYVKNYGYLIDNVKTNLLGEDEFYIYEKDYNTERIKNSVKLNIAYQILDEVKNENSVIEIEEDNLKYTYEEIFGNIDTYKPVNFNDDCIQFIYNKELKKYMAINITCSEKDYEIFRSIKDIYEEDDKLVFKVYIGLLEGEMLSTIDKKQSFEYTSDNISKLPIYKFIYERLDDKYYLNKIEKSE